MSTKTLPVGLFLQLAESCCPKETTICKLLSEILSCYKKNGIDMQKLDEPSTLHEDFFDYLVSLFDLFCEKEQLSLPGQQKLWDHCDEWCNAIGGLFPANEGIRLFLSFLQRPYEDSKEVRLLKLLQTEEYQSAKQLAEKLGISERSVNTYLCALDPNLRAGREEPPRLFGGQICRCRIKRVHGRDIGKDEDPSSYYYRTDDRVHPIALQLNTQQLGELLVALMKQEQAEKSSIIRQTALNIWGQVSEEGKEVLRNNFPKHGFQDYTEHLDRDLKNAEIGIFRSAGEMVGEDSFHDILVIAEKSTMDRKWGFERCELIRVDLELKDGRQYYNMIVKEREKDGKWRLDCSLEDSSKSVNDICINETEIKRLYKRTFR